MFKRTKPWFDALLTVVVAVVIGALIWHLTAGLTLFTSESWRRESVTLKPKVVPDVQLEDERGQIVTLRELCGSVLVINFIFTECPTVCSALGASSSQLARRLQPAVDNSKITVLSISFDPVRDTPKRLEAFKLAMEPNPSKWRVARPTSDEALSALKATFGLVVIPDEFGGYVHNAAFLIVDQDCKLTRVINYEDIQGVDSFVRSLMPAEAIGGKI
jgi:protein SCO1